MAQPRNPKPKRQSVGCTLTPEVAARLHREADARLVSPSLLIEKGLGLLFASFDHPVPDEVDGA